MNIVNLLKEDQEIPDNYGITIDFVISGKEEFKIVSHRVVKETQTLEFLTADDLWNIIPLSSIKKISLDKNFSKIMEFKNKVKKE